MVSRLGNLIPLHPHHRLLLCAYRRPGIGRGELYKRLNAIIYLSVLGPNFIFMKKFMEGIVRLHRYSRTGELITERERALCISNIIILPTYSHFIKGKLSKGGFLPFLGPRFL